MSRRLEGIGVVVTRPRSAAEPLARELEAEGARVHIFPALALEDIEPSAATREALEKLPHASMAIFVSANAAEKGLALVQRLAAWPARTRVAAIGEATAAALRHSGFQAVISPAERHDSEALLALPELQRVRGETILIFRGEGGREHLRETLEARGANVLYAECYRRVRPASDPREVLGALSGGDFQAVSVLSAETLENFMALLGSGGAQAVRGATLVVPHESIARHAAASHFARVVVAGHGARGMIEALSPIQVPE
jgi:uroporphyrinogen-III synthase